MHAEPIHFMPPRPVRAEETFKPRDVDELLDFYVFRRLAAYVVRALTPTSATPNQVTLAAGIVGVLSGIAVWYASIGERSWLLIGAGLLLFSMVLDCSDGQLARIRGGCSMLGRVLDGISDMFTTTSIFVGLVFYLDVVIDLGPWGWALAWAAGASTLWHTYLYDAAKNTYLTNTKPPEPGGVSGLVLLDSIRAELDEARRNRQWIAVGALAFFLAHSGGQQKNYRNGLPADEAITRSPEERDLYRQEHLLSMRLWSFLGLATHLFSLAMAAALAYWDPTAPLWIFGLLVVPTNILYLWLMRTDPGRARRVQDQIARLRAA